MQKFRWQILLGIFLILLSTLFYFVHFKVFQDPHHIFIFLVSDIAFIPIEVLFVTIIIHQLLSAREKRHIMEKLNMLIGVFFSEMGNVLVADFSDFDPDLEKIQNELIIKNNWEEKEFKKIKKELDNHNYNVGVNAKNFKELKEFFREKRQFLLNLLENPNLLEHESFTELLLAVFHLMDELEHRENFNNLPESDIAHLHLDIHRAYKLLVYEWIIYMQYMKRRYPYLFSLALRMNPFDQNASVIVKN